MPVYRLSECYGALGPRNEVAFTTTTLLNCSAIIFYNATSGFLGLYHYGGLTLMHPGTLTILTRMLNDARPSELVIFEANTETGFGFMTAGDEALSITLDNEYLEFALTMMKGADCSLRRISGQSFIGVSANAGGLVFGKPTGADGPPPVQAGTAREQRGNITFYHSAPSADRRYHAFIQASVQAEFEGPP